MKHLGIVFQGFGEVCLSSQLRVFNRKTRFYTGDEGYHGLFILPVWTKGRQGVC